MEKRDRHQDTEDVTRSMGGAGGPAALSSHAKGRPFSMWLHVAGVVWSRAERHDGGGSRGSRLPTHFLCTLRIKPWAQSTVWLTQ